ncbi:hypothetical protein FA15DRAFT_635551 [Coprinopsis marcescibilis]|uniref:BTB domain-containing protein n=1 Tax=Coprinopsis marcescibilis TaxID=230819 RepID=A0A5C3L484_COPMA|nr:hypothetical protein FA15DRAFT_635551 [Coprinopsis marcescibilis]
MRDTRAGLDGLSGASISSARDRGEEPSRKRQRVNEDEESQPLGAHTSSRSTKDPECYSGPRQAGDHIVLVQGVLFKFKDHSLGECQRLKEKIYRGRASIPAGKEWTDEAPYKVEDPRITPTQFRSLHWFLHLSPEENVALKTHPTVNDFTRILHLSAICKTYAMNDVYRICFEFIEQKVTKKEIMDPMSSEELTTLVKAIIHLQGTTTVIEDEGVKLAKTLTNIENFWCERVIKKDGAIGSVPSIHAAEQLNLSRLRGTAYYQHLEELYGPDADQRVSTDGIVTPPKVNARLNKEQLIRLFFGHSLLVNFWDTFRPTPMQLPRAHECSEEEHKICSAAWNNAWKTVLGWGRLTRIASFRVPELIYILRDMLSNEKELTEPVRPACKRAGLLALQKKREELQMGLGSYFLGCITA